MPNALIIAGIVILLLSLRPLRQLLIQLPEGSLRNYWKMLTGLVGLFITGYAAVELLFWAHFQQLDFHDMFVPVILFSGSVFVWLTCTLSLRTALDLRRMVLLERENITDPLLGIYNKRYLDRRLVEEVARAKRYGQPLSILMVDIDHFKRINDRYGHQAGDLALSYLGNLILDSIRQFDVAARFGGEEILIIAPNTRLQAARELAERLRQTIESHELGLISEANMRIMIRMTVSIGIAGLDLTDGTAELLIAESDKAMYDAKQQGRNQVVVFQDLPASRAAD